MTLNVSLLKEFGPGGPWTHAVWALCCSAGFAVSGSCDVRDGVSLLALENRDAQLLPWGYRNRFRGVGCTRVMACVIVAL